jgi:ABC-2 type transport system permease protein
MNPGRILSLVKKEWKKTVREPAVLFMIILFPVILTIAFGASFGATAGSQQATFSVAAVDLSSGGGNYSAQFTHDLSATGVLSVHSYQSNGSAQSALSQGQVQAVLLIPPTFDASVQSYLSHPSEPGAWVNSSLSLYLDRASLISGQVVPSVVQEVLVSGVLGEKQAAAPSPVGLTSPSLVQVRSESVFDTFVPGLFAFASIFLIMMVAQSFTSDRESGMLRRVATTPASASEIMSAQVLSYLLIGVVQALLVLGSAFALGYRPDNGVSGVALGLVIASVFSVCNVGFGLIAASIARTAGAATGISFLFLLPQMFLGTYVGMALSSSAQSVGRFVPSYYVTDALNSLFTRGAAVTSATVLTDLGVVAASSLLVLVAGICIFRKFGRP